MKSANNSFIESLADMPPEDVFKALEKTCRALENGTCQKTEWLNEKATSLITFRRFLNAVMLRVRLTRVCLPAEHVAAYRKCIERLINVGRLPKEAKEEFDATFSNKPA